MMQPAANYFVSVCVTPLVSANLYLLQTPIGGCRQVSGRMHTAANYPAR